MPVARAAVALAVSACLVAAGCGGGSAKPHAAASPATRAPASPTPTPSYSVNEIGQALLKPTDVAPDLRIATSADVVQEIPQDNVPGCSDSFIALHGVQAFANQQFEAPNFLYTGLNYIQVAAVFANAPAALAAFSVIGQRLSKCPPKKSSPGSQIGTKKFRPSHVDTWSTTEDSVSGWTHIRGFEKNVEPPSSSKYNVYYLAFDYVLRGNVILSLTYWRRTTPGTQPTYVANPATAVLVKQLGKIGPGTT